jgi:hypothetical protein
MYTKRLTEALEAAKIVSSTAQNIFQDSLTFKETKIDYLAKCAKMLFDNNPIKVGSIVVLKKSPEITQRGSPGWWHFRNFLVKGIVGIVKDIDISTFDVGTFFYRVEWFNQTYIDYKGKTQTCDPPGSFFHNEEYIELASDDVVQKLTKLDSSFDDFPFGD